MDFSALWHRRGLRSNFQSLIFNVVCMSEHMQVMWSSVPPILIVFAMNLTARRDMRILWTNRDETTIHSIIQRIWWNSIIALIIIIHTRSHRQPNNMKWHSRHGTACNAPEPESVRWFPCLWAPALIKITEFIQLNNFGLGISQEKL